MAGRDAYANASPLAPADVSLACSPAHALADISITPNNSPSVVVVKATVNCEGVAASATRLCVTHEEDSLGQHCCCICRLRATPLPEQQWRKACRPQAYVTVGDAHFS